MRTVEDLTLFARPASLWFCIVEAAPSRDLGSLGDRQPRVPRPPAAPGQLLYYTNGVWGRAALLDALHKQPPAKLSGGALSRR